MITSSASSSKQHPHGPIQCYLLIYAALKVYRQYLTLFTLQKCSLTRWNIFYKYSSLTEHVNTISADNDLKARISDIVVVAYNSILLWAFKLGSKTTFFADSRKFHKFYMYNNYCDCRDGESCTGREVHCPRISFEHKCLLGRLNWALPSRPA